MHIRKAESMYMYTHAPDLKGKALMISDPHLTCRRVATYRKLRKVSSRVPKKKKAKSKRKKNRKQKKLKEKKSHPSPQNHGWSSGKR